MSSLSHHELSIKNDDPSINILSWVVSIVFAKFVGSQMRFTKKVSMWPVGLVTKVGLSSPVVNDKGVVVDFFDGWMANRKFPVDMAGFAVSVQLVLEVSMTLVAISALIS